MTKSKTPKQKKKANTRSHTPHHHGNDVLHRGEKNGVRCVCVCVQREEKKKKKKSSGKRKNVA